MINSPTYTITEILREGSGTVVYRAVRRADGRPVVLKVLAPRRYRSSDLGRLKSEYAIGKTLDTPAAVKPIALETYQGAPALVLEDFDGQSLDGLLGAPLSLDRFLTLAVRIAAALADIHRQGIVHKDLKPQNILVNQALEVKIADFGFASRLPREPQAARPPRLIEGSLPYISPEQTGRMNRALDHRTDLYSLGVTLYEMLTGVRPFQATDPMELVHSHIARRPVPPHELSPEIPEAVSTIVMKLLSKAAEDRYQSASGLKADLRECMAQLDMAGHITPFPLGQQDCSYGLLIPQKLYGRDAEVRALLSAWERVDQGAAELVLVSGYSGVGKSALVKELYKIIAGRRARFIAGKFDQLNRNVPYASLAQAFRELVRDLLAEPAEALELSRHKLTAALGQSGQVLVDLIPELELAIGRQPSLPELGPTESQNRFNLAFQGFLRVFTMVDHPLVLFLDDLQWADLASIKLLTMLLSDPERAYLLVIGAYRDNEVDVGHPLSLALAELRSAGTRVVEITVEPLRLPEVSQIVADALGCEEPRSAPLAKLVFEKTQGNPFFINQLLLTLYKDQWLTFDAPSCSFCWDLDRIREAAFTENVVDFMTRRLRRFSPRTQRILTLAACIGHEFDLETLSTVGEEPLADTAADLWEALREDIVLPLTTEYRFLHPATDTNGEGGLAVKDFNVTYRFSHDRVQQAAYALIEDERKQELHLSIGRLLLARRDLGEGDDKLFDVVNHLNLGSGRIAGPSERVGLARLNLAAGNKARAGAAYKAAAGYFAAGASLLPGSGWEDEFDLSFNLHLALVECDYLSGQFEEAEALFDVLLSRAPSHLERANIQRLRSRLYLTQGRAKDALCAGRAALQLFGIDLPRGAEEEKAALGEELALGQRGFAGRRLEELAHATPVTDPERRTVMRILSDLAAPAYQTSPLLHSVVIAKMVNLSLEHGHSEVSAWAYASYAWIFREALGQDSYRLSTLALDLYEESRNIEFGSKVYMIFAVNLCFFKHLRTTLDYLSRARWLGLQSGDAIFCSFSCIHTFMNTYASGEELGAVRREADGLLAMVRRCNDTPATMFLTIGKQMIASLTGATKGRCSLSDDTFDEDEFTAKLLCAGVALYTLSWYYTVKLQLAFLDEAYDVALTMAAKAEETIESAAGFHMRTVTLFYTALTFAAVYPDASPSDKVRYAEEIERRQAELAALAAGCPENFQHAHLLLLAEQARVGGDAARAMDLYDEAIKRAHEDTFLHHEALANELAAKFHLARGRTKIARVYMADALDGYLRWGAEAKVAGLLERYGGLLSMGAAGADGGMSQLDRLPTPPLDRRPIAATATFAARTEQIDLLAVVKASQTISGDIVRDRLVRTLLEVVLEQGGAQRGYLLFGPDEDLRIGAIATLDDRGLHAEVIEPLPVERSRLLPSSVVRYVRRTKERVILDDAAVDAGRFAADEFIARTRPRSVLCLPILRQAEVFGLLYLENNLAPGAFTPDRLAVLGLLASQAAISLENAQLLSKEQAGRQSAEEAERRAAFLAEASEILGESLEHEEVLLRLARLSVRWLADWCTIDLLEEGELRRVAGMHTDPAMQPELEELGASYPSRLNPQHPACRVMQGREALLLSDLSDAVIKHSCVDDEHERLLHRLGLRSALAVPLVARGEILGVITLVSGESGRHYAPTDLDFTRELARRAAVAIDNARLYRATQDAVRLRDDFLAVASHELRTPMTSLSLTLESLRRTTVSGRPLESEATGRFTGRAQRQCTRLSKLVEDLLDVSRIEAGRLPIEPGEVDLHEVVREVVARFELDLQRSGCTISVRAGPPVLGHWDRHRLDQVMTNLLSNAIKFGAGKPIGVVIEAQNGLATLRVEDHGIGIDPSEQKHIFERFGRAVSVRNYGGLGLGLYISRKIVEAHGGSIRVESRPGTGAAFTVELPGVLGD